MPKKNSAPEEEIMEQPVAAAEETLDPKVEEAPKAEPIDELEAEAPEFDEELPGIDEKPEETVTVLPDSEDEQVSVVPKDELNEQPAAASEQSEESKTRTRRQYAAERRSRAEQSAIYTMNEEARQAAVTKMATLRNYVNRKTVLKANVAAVELLELGGRSQWGVSLFLDDSTKVLIPYEEIYFDNPIERSERNPRGLSEEELSTPAGRREYQLRQRQMLNRLIGAPFNFCLSRVYAPDEDGNVLVLGTRREALLQLRNRAFYGRAPRITEGMVTEADIIAVGDHGISVVLGGVDYQFSQWQLTLRYMDTTRTHFKPGDKIKVLVRSIRADANYNVRLELDHIAIELAEAKRKLSLIKDGSRSTGIVTRVGQNASNIYVWLTELNMPARLRNIGPHDFNRNITRGTTLQVQVVGREPTKGLLHCVVLGEHGNSLMLSSFRIANFGELE